MKVYLLTLKNQSYVNIFDKSKNIIEIISDVPFDGLTKPIQIAFDNGFAFNEIQFIKENKKTQSSLIYFYFIAFIGG